MLTNFLEKSKPINFIIYLGLFLCFFLIALIATHFTNEFTWIKVLESIGYFFLFLLIFFFYNFVVVKNKLTFDNSYAFFLFVLITIVFVSKLLEFKVLILLLIHLLFLRKIYSLRSPKKVIQKLFDSGFWLGVLFILEPFSILFFILLVASILLQQKITVQNLVSPFVGFIAPLIIYFAYLFWIDANDSFSQLFYLNAINNLFIYTEDYTIWVFGTLLLLTVFSILIKSPKALSVNNSFKKSWVLLITNLIVAVFFALIITEKNGSEVLFLTIPASVIIANGLEIIQKKIVKDVLWSVLIIGAILTFLRL